MSEDRAEGRPTPAARETGEVELTEAARRLGVHYMTTYRYVRTGQLPATRRGGRWWVGADAIRDFRADRGRRPRRAVPAGAGRAGSPKQLVRRLVQGDEGGCWQLLQTELENGREPQHLLTDGLAVAMRRIGDAWAAGALTVAHEHRATAVALRLLARLAPMCVRPGRPRGAVLLACVPGEQHSLPSAIVAAVVRGAGYTVVELGADTPLDALEETVAGQDLVAVGLSVGSQDRLEACRTAIRVVRGAMSTGPAVPLLVGGPAVTSEQQARELGADRWAGDALGVLEVLDEVWAARR
ncbi:MAG TPA: B12-binding domain-containing protein [Actinomycetales bacterium]|nr:B12-binding domain-containing protein [Actinomycetales bacterium]